MHSEEFQTITNIAEKGAVIDGVRKSLDRRLFMQLHVFGKTYETESIINVLKERNIESVLYKDLNDPYSVGLLTMDEDPDFFVSKLRETLQLKPFTRLELKREFTMTGRTYALGHEENLEEWLIHRPKKISMSSAWPWAVWYPLRRRGEFELLAKENNQQILMEHARIGRAFGKADLGHDIRLACHGLDKNDNDFVIGVIGKELYPLSALVQTMRKTQQTSKYIDHMGPFFVGKTFFLNPSSK